MLFLLIKLFTTPALIWASTLAARRWGPVIGGGLAGLPFISGPASLFIAVQYGTPFAASAAASSLLGAVASCLRLLPDIPGTADMRRVQPPWRLPVQMFCGGLSVLILTELAGVVGEQWSGILLTFPIISSILTPFAHLSFVARAAVFSNSGSFSASGSASPVIGSPFRSR